MKIYYLAPNPVLSLANKKKLEALGEVFYSSVKKTSEQQIADSIQNADVLLIPPSAVQKLTNNFFKLLPNLKFVSLLSSGYEWVDIKSAAENQVSISNCVGANSVSVAEYTWGLILTLSRRIGEYERGLHALKKNMSKQYEGIELNGKTLGILGTGNIGTHVAKIGKSFGMNVLGYSKHSQPKPEFDQIVDIIPLLKKSDIISIHLPFTTETENLINKDMLKHVKKGAIIVNTAREKIVNKAAIIDFLKKETISGYGVDVEISDFNDLYFQLPNLIVSGHNAFNTKEAKQKMQDLAIKNIESFIKGRPINLVSL